MVRWLSALMVAAVGLYFVAATPARADEKKSDKPAKEKKDKDTTDKSKDTTDKSAEDHGFMGVEVGGGGDEGGPVTIRTVNEDSPAAKAGIKEGDEVVRIGDNEVKSVQDLLERMRGTKPGDKITVTVKREGKEHKLSVTLGKRPTDNP